MLAAGQDAGWLCIVRCDPPISATLPCPHDNAFAVVTGDESCDDTVPDTPALVRENVGRSDGRSDAHHAALVPRYQFAALAAAVSSVLDPGREWGLENRPPVTALRI